MLFFIDYNSVQAKYLACSYILQILFCNDYIFIHHVINILNLQPCSKTQKCFFKFSYSSCKLDAVESEPVMVFF